MVVHDTHSTTGNLHSPPIDVSAVFEQCSVNGSGMSTTVASSFRGPLKWSVTRIVATPSSSPV
jgi:hypothetical protein